MRRPEDRPTVLLADDEKPIRDLLRAQLTPRGYSICEAGTGAEALATASTARPDVILLDLGLPDIDGIEVIRRLRSWTDTPIVVLSVRAAESDKIEALDAGADDYLTKPCHPADLQERIRTAVALRANETARVFSAGDLEVDLARHSVQLSGTPIQLTVTEFDVLRILVLNAGRLRTQPWLARQVWRDKPEEEARQLLRVAIGALRTKLEVNPARPRHIATEPGVGFRLRTEP